MSRTNFAILMSFLALFSCQKFDNIQPDTGSESNIRISVCLPEGMGVVRSQENPGSGDMVNRCIMEVYLDGKLYGERMVSEVENKQATFDARLITGKNYRLVFWADCADGDAPENFTDKYYSTADLADVSILNPDQYDGSNDGRDAFYAVKEVSDFTSSSSISVELRRPFGQLNVKTLDMGTVPADLRPSNVSIDFDAVPAGINLLTGELTDKTVDIAYAESRKLPDESGDLTFDYIFAPQATGEQRLVNFTMSFLNEDGSEAAADYVFTNIPVQRNYRTNVSGNLLTGKASVTVTVDPIFSGDAVISDVTSIEELNAALAEGTEYVVLSQAPAGDASIVIPHSYSTEDKEITIVLPEFGDGATLNLGYDGATGYAPETIYLKAEYIDNLVINAEESSVVLEGSFGSIEAATADNTLVISESSTVSSLKLTKGNLKLYGVVESLTKADGWEGTIYRCFDSQKSYDNLVSDNVSGYSEILVEQASAEVIDGKAAKFSRQMTISAPVSVNNFRIDVDYSGAYGLKIVEGATKVSMDNVIVSSTSKAARTAWIEVDETECNFSNCKFIAPTGVANKSGLNLIATSPSCVQNITLDNVLISIDEERMNADMSTDYEYSDALEARVPGFSRGITVGHSDGLNSDDVNGAVINLTMKNSAIESLYYSINVITTKVKLNLEADNCVFDGRAALNVWGQNPDKQYLNYRNCKLIGRNWFGGPTEEFANIVVNYEARGYCMTLDNCDIVSDNDPQTETNRQYLASFRSPYRNSLVLLNGTRFRETVNPRLDHAIDIDDDSWINEVSWDDSFKISCADNATVLVSDVWNGSLLEASAMPSEEDGKYYIGTPVQLANWVSEKLGGNAVLVRDLDLNDLQWPVSTSGDAITGTFDGNGHTIRNLNCQTYLVESDGANGLAWDNKAQNAALFPVFSGDIRNLTIDGATIYGSRSGALVGRYNGGTIDNCHMKNIKITGGAQKVAALVGYAANYSDAVFSNCSVENATISADKNAPAGGASCMAGGFIGYMSSDGVSVTVKNNVMKNVVVESGNLWDTSAECASHVFVGDLINISKTSKSTITFENNELSNCELLNAQKGPYATDYFGFYYKSAPSGQYPYVNTIVIDRKVLVE